MQVNHFYEVRTPYTEQISSTFNGAKEYFLKHAQEMGVDLVWRKGQGSIRDGKRYHFWVVRNETDANAFFLACGDRIKRHNGIW